MNQINPHEAPEFTAASRGNWFHWLLLNISLGWLFGRLQRPRPTT